jgi:hypothetical protein
MVVAEPRWCFGEPIAWEAYDAGAAGSSSAGDLEQSRYCGFAVFCVHG